MKHFANWGQALVAIAIVERWPLWRGLNNIEPMYGLSARTKKVVVVKRWLLAEV